MDFSVIYSVDVPEDEDAADFAPPELDLWDQTEDDKEYDYSEGVWENGHHRKWTAILNREQFSSFVDRCGLFAENIETGGSIGAPGCGLGCVPAISFSSHSSVAIQSAYVTPLCNKQNCNEKDWERVKRAILSVYS